MDIYKRLKKDHEKQRALCAELLETEGDTQERREKWSQLKTELEAHAAAEEQTFYAEVITHSEATDMSRHSVHEHQEMTKLIQELDETEMDTGAWLNKFKKLAHQVEHHLEEEEKHLFPKAKELLSDKVEDELADDFNERKAEEIKNH